MSLPIKKIYVDSKHKLSTSASNSDFKVELKESYLMPEGAVFKICDVCIPHSWTTIMTGINDKFYFYVSNTNHISTRPQTGYIATLEAENLNGAELATKLASAMNTREYQDLPNLSKTLSGWILLMKGIPSLDKPNQTRARWVMSC